MANAKKCDICTNYYEFYNTNSKKKANAVAFLNTDTVTLVGGPIDCCPECMTAVETFVEELRGFDKETAKAKALMSIHAMDKADKAYKKLLFMDRRGTKDEMWAVIDEAIGVLGEALDYRPEEEVETIEEA